MIKKFPFAKPQLNKMEFRAVAKVIRNPILVHGKQTESFEKNFSKFTKSPYSLAVSSATAGLHLFYFVLGIGKNKNDEVIVSSQTHVATAHAILLSGAKPIFVDSNEHDGNIDVKKIETLINKNTKAIAVVHYLGIPCDMKEIIRIAKKYNLYVLEDCALAIGAKYNNTHVGLLGDAGVFSFYPVKHMTTVEGGMVITKNKKIAEKIKFARAFGVDKSFRSRNIPGDYEVNSLGFNYRMNEIEATIGIEQLKKIPKFLSERKKNFLALKNILRKSDYVDIIDCQSKTKISSHYCCAIVLKKNFKKRLDIIKKLKKLNIGTSIYYPKPVPHFNFYKKKFNQTENFKNASKFSYKTLALPVGPHLSLRDIKYIGNSFISILDQINNEK